MRSKAHFKGHPLHPMLIAFPIAFLYGGLVADAVGRAGGWPSVWTTGAYLSVAAVVSGLVAGVPGLIDYLSVVPPRSSGKRRATWHMVVNVSALACFALGWVFRDMDTLLPGWGTLLLEAAGVGLVTWGGWMGGILVYRNQIGVDHRYADAGKWAEQTVDAQPGQTVAVARADELRVGQMKLLHVGGRRIVLARTDDGYAAFDDRCSHRGGPLADGALICGTVQCPWHGSQFDAHDGAVRAGPAEQPIATYRVEEAGGEVRLTVPAA
jgi:nitrite reductase/ring-hydroxylating ferredoxin subunit/uncharacterized membrane protein